MCIFRTKKETAIKYIELCLHLCLNYAFQNFCFRKLASRAIYLTIWFVYDHEVFQLLKKEKHRGANNLVHPAVTREMNDQSDTLYIRAVKLLNINYAFLFVKKVYLVKIICNNCWHIRIVTGRFYPGSVSRNKKPFDWNKVRGYHLILTICTLNHQTNKENLFGWTIG